eukprot:1158084-Pelagomonas_calceolata.AAC.19
MPCCTAGQAGHETSRFWFWGWTTHIHTLKHKAMPLESRTRMMKQCLAALQAKLGMRHPTLENGQQHQGLPVRQSVQPGLPPTPQKTGEPWCLAASHPPASDVKLLRSTWSRDTGTDPTTYARASPAAHGKHSCGCMQHRSIWKFAMTAKKERMRGEVARFNCKHMRGFLQEPCDNLRWRLKRGE